MPQAESRDSNPPPSSHLPTTPANDTAFPRAFSELYTEHAEAKAGGPNIAEHRAALKAFFAYALGKPEVRLVNTKELLSWLRDPFPLR